MPEATPLPPDLVSLRRDGKRCPPTGSRALTVLSRDGGVFLHEPIPDALERHGEAGLPRRGGGRILRLARLPGVAGAKAVEVWPCEGKSLRVPAEDLENWVVAPNQRGHLRLMNLADEESRPRMRNIAAFELR